MMNSDYLGSYSDSSVNLFVSSENTHDCTHSSVSGDALDRRRASFFTESISPQLLVRDRLTLSKSALIPVIKPRWLNRKLNMNMNKLHHSEEDFLSSMCLISLSIRLRIQL